MTKGNAAVHATAALFLQFHDGKMIVEFLPVVHAFQW